MSENLKPCPFCKEKAQEHPNPKWQKQYRVIYHKPDSFLYHGSDFELIPSYNEAAWNRRSGEGEAGQYESASEDAMEYNPAAYRWYQSYHALLSGVEKELDWQKMWLEMSTVSPEEMRLRRIFTERLTALIDEHRAETEAG